MAPPFWQDAFNSLKEMFPDVADRLVKAALFSNDYDVNDAAYWLLTEGIAGPPADAQPVPWWDPSPVSEEASTEHAPSPACQSVGGLALTENPAPEHEPVGPSSALEAPPHQVHDSAPPPMDVGVVEASSIPAVSPKSSPVESFLLHLPCDIKDISLDAGAASKDSCASASLIIGDVPSASAQASVEEEGEAGAADGDSSSMLADAGAPLVPPGAGSLGVDADGDDVLEIAIPMGSAQGITVAKGGTNVTSATEAMAADEGEEGSLVGNEGLAEDAPLQPSHTLVPDAGADGGLSPDWVVTALPNALPAVAGSEASDEDTEDESETEEDGLLVEGEGLLGTSMGSLSVFDSQMEAAFDKDSFDSALGRSAALKDSLQQDMLEVEDLRKKVVATEIWARRAENMLQLEKEQDVADAESTHFLLKKARDELEQRSSVLASEKGLLNFEARQLRSRLLDQSGVKLHLEEQLKGLKEGLLVKQVELERRIELAEEEMRLLEVARQARKVQQNLEMDAIAEHQRDLEKEKEACTELKSFLDTRKEAVDTIAGGISKCADDIEFLRRTIEEDAGSVEETPLQSAQPSLAASAASLPASGSLDMGTLQTRVSMREVLAGLLSSSEGSTPASSTAASSSSSSALFGSVEVLGTSPRQAALHMLSLMSGSKSGAEGGGAGEGSDDTAMEMMFPAVPMDPSVVRVSEDEIVGPTEGAAGNEDKPRDGGDEGQTELGLPKEKEDGWEDVEYPDERVE